MKSDKIKSEKVKIEHNIPIPPDPRGGNNSKYPFKDMKVGDSIIVNRKSTTSVHYASKKYKMKFTRRAINNKEWRVWRIK